MRDSFETLQLSTLEGGTYSARLMPVIAELLQQNGFSKNNVDGFVVVLGPGSFTGLRVGLATVKGLCEVLGKPLATVSMLEAMVIAHGAGEIDRRTGCRTRRDICRRISGREWSGRATTGIHCEAGGVCC